MPALEWAHRALSYGYQRPLFNGCLSICLSLCLQENSNSASSVWIVPWGPSLGAARAAVNPGQSESCWGLQAALREGPVLCLLAQ